ncbi:MAG: hypothetical protein IE927_02655 [Rhodobacterales bacterium]|nr:hypothetical protein [Rhodobacterales bacterium]
MARFIRPLTLALALIVALTSGTMAVARGQTRVGDRIVICSGYGLVTVELDENGTPVGPVHICPDCTLSHLAHLPAAAPVLRAPQGRARRLGRPRSRHGAGRPQPRPRARGPPGAV